MSSDLQRHAGIDIAAVYVPDIDEFLQLTTVNVCPGTVDDSPPALATGLLRVLQQRVSFTVGFANGSISSNGGSAIDGDQAYLYGPGWRLFSTLLGPHDLPGQRREGPGTRRSTTRSR